MVRAAQALQRPQLRVITRCRSRPLPRRASNADARPLRPIHFTLTRLSQEPTMRIFPIALIVIGALGVAKYLGLIPIGTFHLVGPLLLIALGVALLFRRPRH